MDSNLETFAPGQEHRLFGRSLRLERLLGKGKSGYSWLATNTATGACAVLKQIHQEPCSYYQFDDKLKSELEAYEQLCTIGVSVPRLLAYDTEREMLLKEFIDGSVASDVIARGEVNFPIVKTLAEMAHRLAEHGLNADFFPANFVIVDNSDLFYIDYEINPYMEEWSLENRGIYYWANFEGMARFLETGDGGAINRDPARGLPYCDGIICERVKEWWSQLD